MLQVIAMAEVVKQVRGASKNAPVNFYHTWWGWTSKGVLHIKSRSGARTKECWHFPLKEGDNSNLLFKNTTAEAYVYRRPGPQNALEEFVGPYVRIEYVKEIDVHLQRRGRCGLDSPWFAILTDGESEIMSVAHKLRHNHSNPCWCPGGSDTVRVHGGTFAVEANIGQWGTRGLVPHRVIVTRQVNTEGLVSILQSVKEDTIGRGWPPSPFLPSINTFDLDQKAEEEAKAREKSRARLRVRLLHECPRRGVHGGSRAQELEPEPTAPRFRPKRKRRPRPSISPENPGNITE
jgi:hypothetical protein